MTSEEKVEQYRAETGETGSINASDLEFHFLMKDLED